MCSLARSSLVEAENAWIQCQTSEIHYVYLGLHLICFLSITLSSQYIWNSLK